MLNAIIKNGKLYKITIIVESRVKIGCIGTSVGGLAHNSKMGGTVMSLPK